MAIISGCQEGNATPKLTEVSCPACGEIIEVFVKMGGSADKTGRTVDDETCIKCGYVIRGGTPLDELKLY